MLLRLSYCGRLCCANLVLGIVVWLSPGWTYAEESEQIGPAWHDSRNPIVKIFKGERLDLWSLKPIEVVAPPGERAWGRQPFDLYIAAKQRTEKQFAAPEADRRTLGRRLHFDLTGLPPTPERMTAFLADDAPDAYERLVDELHARPSFGEHNARMWLDVVRYSDSNGFDWDEFRPHAWRYRDYVIRSLNADKPWNDFIREQLAGDELLAGPPRTSAEQDALLATSYLCLGPRDNSASLFNEQPRARAEWMSDLVDTTAAAFLGLSFSCCRCHDHKFDPVSQADYYRLRAFFEPLEYADKKPIDLAATRTEIEQHNAWIEEQTSALDKERDARRQRIAERLRAERLSQLSATEQLVLNTSEGELTAEQKKNRQALEKKISPSEKEINDARTAEEKQQDDQWQQAREQLQKQKRNFQFALLATDKLGKVAATRILYQGDHKAERDEVPCGVLSILDPNPFAIQPPSHGQSHGRRLALAHWLTSAENPLVSRVLVNRVWQQFFGRGIVATPNDFGHAGAKPTHPELLDGLAANFRQRWSMKDLQREFVTSATYRQQSQVTQTILHSDPENQLLTRFPLRRLTAEQLLDALLAVSGLLHEKHSGPPIWPTLPADLLNANPAFLDDNAEKTKGWYTTTGGQQFSRGIFWVQKRNTQVPFLQTFDLPENIVSCARRNQSLVAPQALSLLNSPLSAQVVQALSERVKREAGELQQHQIARLFALTLQRSPTANEQALCEPFLARRGLPELCRAVLNLNEFVYLD